MTTTPLGESSMDALAALFHTPGAVSRMTDIWAISKSFGNTAGICGVGDQMTVIVTTRTSVLETA
jgi:hypothetical protein